MVIHFFTKEDMQVGSSRQRAFLVAKELNKRGFYAIVHQPPLIFTSTAPWHKKIKLISQYISSLILIKKEDIIYLQRTIYNKYFLGLIILYKLLFRRKMIFDFDDAIYLHSPSKTKILTKLADAVIVGSHTLMAWAKKYNKNVYLIPTPVQFENYAKYTKKYPEIINKIVIGWAGGAIDQFENLKLLVPVFQKLIDEGLQIKFILIGALGYKPVYELFEKIKGLETEFIDKLDWSKSDAMPRQIQRFDIGVMPLVDNGWNRGKCAFKAIEYMACGVATICSAVGENNYLIRDGQNGFLARNEYELYKKLKQLILDKNLREKLGREGQRTIKKRYSYEVNIPILQAILNNL